MMKKAQVEVKPMDAFSDAARIDDGKKTPF